MTIHGVQSWHCSYCDFTTFDRNTWKQHVLSDHHDLLPFKCNGCECKFLFEDNYMRHIRIHMGERALPCPDCQRK